MTYSLARGTLIAVEGIDGSGKSTLCANITQKLDCILPIVLTKEPGGTPLGKQLRAIVQQPIPRCAQAEFLLFAADRAQHFTDIVLPALAQKRLIISDRMADSSLIYQGHGRGLDLKIIKQVSNWVMHNRKPDVTVYVRIDLQTALERIAKRNQALTAFEQEDKNFMQRLIDGFDKLYSNRDDIILLDGTHNIETLTTLAYGSILGYLQQRSIIK